MGYRFLYVTTTDGVPGKAFQDPKGAADWLAESLGHSAMGVCCPALGVTKASRHTAVLALQEGYPLTDDWREINQPRHAVYRVEWH